MAFRMKSNVELIGTAASCFVHVLTSQYVISRIQLAGAGLRGERARGDQAKL